MSIITDFPAWVAHKHLAVYGAMVAAQVMELRQREGRAPEFEDMERISEEAWAIADLERDHASELARLRAAAGGE